MYGWIPILTHRLRPEDQKQLDNIPLQISDKWKFIKKTYLRSYEPFFKKDGFLEKISLNFNEFTGIKKVIVSCNIKDTGLIKFKIEEIENCNTCDNDIFVNFTLPSVVLDIIKNIYHSHVHHNKLADCEIRPVKANSYDEAILEIVNQYRKKINMYHNTISNLKNRFSFKDIIEDMKSPKNNDCMTRFNAFIKTIKLIPFSLWWFVKRFFTSKSKCTHSLTQAALGDFQYGISFVNLHEKDINKKNEKLADSIRKSFLGANQSLLLLREGSTFRIMYIIAFIAVVFAGIQLVNISNLEEPLQNIILKGLKIIQIVIEHLSQGVISITGAVVKEIITK